MHSGNSFLFMFFNLSHYLREKENKTDTNSKSEEKKKQIEIKKIYHDKYIDT